MNQVARLRSRYLRLVSLLAVFSTSLAAAHEIRPTIATLTVQPAAPAELEIRIDLEAALSGLARADTVEGTAVYEELRALEPDALRRRFQDGSAALLSGFEIKFDDAIAPLSLRKLDIPAVGDKAVSRISTFSAEISIPSKARSVSWRAPAAIGSTVFRLIELPSRRALFAALLQPGEISPKIDIGAAKAGFDFGRYVVLGFEHIVPKGLDHILFVVGLFLLNARLRPLLWQVSAFTLAHSATLALGIYGVLRVPPSIVEPIIAASIVFVAVENLATDRLNRWRPAVVFLFGLIHGLGFAGVLAEIGLPKEAFISALLGFNIGVELGQLAVIAACFLAVGIWFRNRTWYRVAIARPASAAIALIAAYWFIERMA